MVTNVTQSKEVVDYCYKNILKFYAILVSTWKVAHHEPLKKCKIKLYQLKSNMSTFVITWKVYGENIIKLKFA